jgi:hypothetical protein
MLVLGRQQREDASLVGTTGQGVALPHVSRPEDWPHEALRAKGAERRTKRTATQLDDMMVRTCPSPLRRPEVWLPVGSGNNAESVLHERRVEHES